MKPEHYLSLLKTNEDYEKNKIFNLLKPLLNDLATKELIDFLYSNKQKLVCELSDIFYITESTPYKGWFERLYWSAFFTNKEWALEYSKRYELDYNKDDELVPRPRATKRVSAYKIQYTNVKDRIRVKIK